MINTVSILVGAIVLLLEEIVHTDNKRTKGLPCLQVSAVVVMIISVMFAIGQVA